MVEEGYYFPNTTQHKTNKERNLPLDVDAIIKNIMHTTIGFANMICFAICCCIVIFSYFFFVTFTKALQKTTHTHN